MSQRAFDDFDGFAKDYRQIHNETLKFSGADSDFFSEQKVESVKRLEKGGAIKILDLGCGDGNSAVFFNKHFKDCQYTGLDTSAESIGVARSRGLGRSSFETYDGESLPFEDSSYDVVFIACVLHHIAHDRHPALLAEIKRVLRTAGRLYIFEHNPLNPLTQWVVRNCPFDDDAVLLGSRYARRLLSNSGFPLVDLRYTIFFPGHSVFNKLRGLERHLERLPLGAQYFLRAVKPSDR